MQPMLNPNNLPVINSYKDLINFNNSLPQTSKSLTIEKVAYSKNMITVNGQSFGIERFLYNYLLKPRKLRGKVESISDGIDLAADVIDNGKALKQLEDFIRLSNN